jgi:hypothetical protein
MDENNNKEYQQMKGEYLSRMASLEHLLTEFIIELLEIQKFQDDFRKWFVEASISFSYKVTLLEMMLKEDTIIETNFPSLWSDLKNTQKLRNTLAHSYTGFLGDTMTARGKKIPEKQVSSSSLQHKLEYLRNLETTILNFYADLIQGDIPPISADDFADGPM